MGAAALINWLLAPLHVLTAAREGAVEAAGIGIFFAIGLLILLGLWLVTGARRLGLLAARRLAGALALALFALGIAGAMTPPEELGGVDLGQVTAGGSIGAWLASPVGWLMMLALALGGALLIAPRSTRRALRATAAGAALVAMTVGRVAPSPRVSALRRPVHRPGAADPGSGSGPPPSAGAGANDPSLDEYQLALGTKAPQAATSAADAGEAKRRTARAAPSRERRSDDGWRLPPLALLKAEAPTKGDRHSRESAALIERTLGSFGVDAKVVRVNEGPAVTQFWVEPGWEVKTRSVSLRDDDGSPLIGDGGAPRTRVEEVSRTRVRVSRITRLTNDLALALAAPSVRVEAPVPGNPVIGIEVPSADRRLVSLRGVLESKEFRETTAQLPLVLGRDVAGAPIVVDLTVMPHLLIAGATGSGKSVCINSLIACLLMRFSPQMLRLVMVDPKRVELTGYGNIPHLVFSHVITDVDEVVAVLHVVVTEMERRYRRFESAGVRNVAAFNAKSERGEALPFWVVIIDELADLMMAAPIEAEQHLVRLAQLARATGIHLVIATQRPSVDVVTGLIKANFPTRVAFATASQTDARVILDKAGAEKLLGRGDMLFRSTDSTKERRLQGAFVSDEEIAALIAFWTQDRFTDTSRPTVDHLLQQALAERGPPAEQETPAADAPGGRDSEPDSLYEPAVALAAQHTRISTSLLQRRLRIGYPRAARLLDQLEEQGVVSAAEGAQSRRVLIEADPAAPP